MATIARTNFGAVLNACMNRIAAAAGLERQLVYAGRRGRIPKFQGDRDVVVIPSGPTPDGDWNDGHDYVAPLLRRVINCLVRSRLGTDPSERADNWFMDPDRGHFALEEAVLGALHLFQPVSSGGDHLTIEPLHLVPSTYQPDKDQPDSQWGQTILGFECAYIPVKPNSQS
jgi:hypothetical protein